jgi:hypothetical protein
MSDQPPTRKATRSGKRRVAAVVVAAALIGGAAAMIANSSGRGDKGAGTHTLPTGKLHPGTMPRGPHQMTDGGHMGQGHGMGQGGGMGY